MSKVRTLNNIVAFCALMENNGGILGKSPDYIREKFERYCLSDNPGEWLYGLDPIRIGQVIEWDLTWNPKVELPKYERKKPASKNKDKLQSSTVLGTGG